MKTNLGQLIHLYICCDGEIFRVTHICVSEEFANSIMERDPSMGVAAVDDTGLIYLASIKGAIAPAAVIADVQRQYKKS